MAERLVKFTRFPTFEIKRISKADYHKITAVGSYALGIMGLGNLIAPVTFNLISEYLINNRRGIQLLNDLAYTTSNLSNNLPTALGIASAVLIFGYLNESKHRPLGLSNSQQILSYVSRADISNIPLPDYEDIHEEKIFRTSMVGKLITAVEDKFLKKES